MAKKPRLQQDFSGGEISASMLMRADLEVHGKALLEMNNFIPTLQGTAVRVPGTKFIKELTGDPTAARIIPYVLPNGARSIVTIKPKVGAVLGDLEILANIGGASNAPTQTLGYDYIVPNGNLDQQYLGFTATPRDVVNSQGAILGWVGGAPGQINCALSRGSNVPSNSPISAIISGSFIIPETTTEILVAPKFFYNSNAGNKDYGLHVEIRIGTTMNGSEKLLLNVDNLTIGGTRYAEQTLLSGAFTAGDVLWISIYVAANPGPGNDGNSKSSPELVVTDINVLSKVTKTIGATLLAAVVPYLDTEIDDVHFVQSPYTALDPLNQGVGKELVMTHPNHPPKRLYLNVGVYTFEDIFTVDANQHHLQFSWSTNGYPSTCGSFLGRLVLAGSTEGSVSSPNGSSSETVWMTQVGDWGKFSDPAVLAVEVLPSDSIVFTAIYRSSIQWVAGQKQLLIGAAEMEYTASADGIFQPADLGVAMHSTHGSNRVQPVTMGSNVLFPAEGGTKVRSMQYMAEQQGWVAPDATMYHPTLLAAGIRRMVRMRNPHQMAVVLSKNGQLALFHADTDSGVFGWSRMVLSDNVTDVAVISDTNGVDVLYMLVKRSISGVVKTYIESIPIWNIANQYSHVYLQSSITNVAVTTTNVITGLSSLEGRFTQVVADGNLLGTFQVIGGVITLTNQIGEAINYRTVSVGLPMQCSMTTLPLITTTPDSLKKYDKITVRTAGSTRPFINGERSADREPLQFLGFSQNLDFLYDNEVAVLGHDATQVISISETLPFRVEVLGIFGQYEELNI